jgi:hypothetical protein
MTDTKSNLGLDNINDVFKIPICYNKNVQKLNEHIVTDLELVNSIEQDEPSIYNNVFKPNNKPASKVIEQFANYYTTDTNYLKDTQQLIKSINSEELTNIHSKHSFSDFELNDVVSLWEEIKGETGFHEKYLYIDWAFAKQLNNNSSFLQLMSIYNIASPILSLCLPIFVLIIPFFIIKLKGIELNIKEYIEILKVLISNHSIFKVFTQFHQVDNSQKIYLVISAAFYLFSIYQNILICIRFYSNMQKIHNYLYKFRKYLSYTLDLMNYHSSKTTELTNYNQFNIVIDSKKNVLSKLYEELNKITPFTFSFSKIGEIGHIMCLFYQLYNNDNYNDALLYSFGFNGYFNMISQTGNNVEEKKLVKTQFIDNKKGEGEGEVEKKEEEKEKGKREKRKGNPVFKKMYYPKFINDDDLTIIKNDCNLNKNMIITGPNASGKTTTLKTALINVILSQQIGYGCFESLKLYPYDNIHCYLNIPDTSGRDSLFQAEARRCKDIIDCINEKNDSTHFCIFDELYSGTNPEEAVVSAFAFMDYIVKNDNVTCLLTTHYVKLCKKLSKNKLIKNYNMKTLKKNDNFEYTYLLEEGISKVKGGLKVLKDMNYPKEILDNTK